MLTAAAADFDESWLPDAPQREYSDLLSQPKEFFGQDFTPPCSLEQISLLKRDRNQFTAAEDSLVFRGVVRTELLATGAEALKGIAVSLHRRDPSQTYANSLSSILCWCVESLR